MTREAEAVRFLGALRAAGCDCFVEDNQFLCSPPIRHIDWPKDPEAAIEDLHDELRDLVLIERDAQSWRLLMAVQSKMPAH
jgi:hypothetical protein